jgi:carboxylesterase
MELIPGAEPWSHTATPGAPGALCLHGFTGNPSTMRGIAEALAAAGFNVELPRLPGHGTTVADMLGTTWADWSAEAEAALERVAARSGKVVVAGLSMGGSLTTWLATRHPELAGIVLVNPLVKPQEAELIDIVKGMVDSGETLFPGIGSDIAKEGVVESAYAETPLVPLLSLMDGVSALQPHLASVRCPVLLMNSPQDHVVDPSNAEHLAASVAGPVERVTLERSYHVATLDHDKELIEEQAVAFARRVVA